MTGWEAHSSLSTKLSGTLQTIHVIGIGLDCMWQLPTPVHFFLLAC